MTVKMTQDQMRAWIDDQVWYQTIELHDGLVTPGKFDTRKRLSQLFKIDFRSKSVLDIGCNSGQYCLYAKKMGAGDVVGIDIDEKRLEQARILSEYEGCDISYRCMGIFDAPSLGKYDIVLCIAVITEVPDLIGAIGALRSSVGDYAFLELDLARPLFHLASIKRLMSKRERIPAGKSIAEMRMTKRGDWMISPTIEILAELFGAEFRLRRIGRGVRYDMVEVVRLKCR